MPAKIPVLGVGISLVDLPAAVREIDGWVLRREPGFVCVRDVHGVVRAQDEPALARAHQAAGLVVADGLPLVKLLQWGRHAGIGRVRGADLFRETCRLGIARDYRHFLYGGAEGTADRLAESLRDRFPGIRIVGTHCPPFRPLTEAEAAAEVKMINASGADIVWVGLSTPKQELWMALRLGRLSAPVMIGVGAAFDFLTGQRPEAPGFVQRSGFEWLYRALSEPTRLGPRYARIVPRFLWLLMQERLTGRGPGVALKKVPGQAMAQSPASILFMAPLPPPVHGVTMVSQQVADLLADATFRVERVDIGQSQRLEELGSGRIAKLLRLSLSLGRLMLRPLSGGRAEIAYTTLSPFGSARFRDGLVILAGKLAARRCLVHLHAEGLDRIVAGRRAGDRLLRFCLRGTELLAITARSAEIGRCSGLFTAVRQVANAVAGPDGVELRAPGPLRILYLSNLIPSKGIREAVAALELLARDGHDFQAKLVGGPTAELGLDEVARMVAEAGIADRVEVPGPLYGAEKAAVLGWADILVYPSRHDHAPLVVLEAMAHGVVPIVCDTGGVAELPGPELAANIVPAEIPPPRIVESFRDRLRDYAADPAALAQARLAAHTRHRTTFTPDRFQREMLRAFANSR